MSSYGPQTPVVSTRGRFEPRGVEVRNSVDLGGFFAILRRQRFWIIVGFAIMFGLAFVYITMAPLAYTSTISILIDARDRQPVGSDQAPMPQQADPIMVESQLKLMTSEAVLKRVAIDEHLESDPEFAPSDHAGLVSSLLGLIERGTVAAPAMEQITQALFDRIQVKRSDRSYVIDMDVRAATPGKAARLADAVAKAFIDEERAAADAYTQDQSNWVVQRTNELRAKVETAEKNVQDYKAANGIVDVAGTLTDEQQLQDANRDLVAARAKAGEAQARVDQIRRIIASGKALDGTYDTINSTVIRQLRVQYSDLIRRQAAASQKYGTRHPEYLDIEEQLAAVKGQINEEMQRISSALTNEAQVARGTADDAQKRVQILEAKTTDTNQTSLKLKELLRQADGERTNYEKFLRANDSIRRDLTETPYARILAPASFPSKPSSPKVIAALLIAASGGLSLGIGLAIAMDYATAPPQPVFIQSASPLMPGSGPGAGPPWNPGPGGEQGPDGGPGGGQGRDGRGPDQARPLTQAPFEAPNANGPFGADHRDDHHEETGFAKLRSMVTGRRPLVPPHPDSVASPMRQMAASAPGAVEAAARHQATSPQDHPATADWRRPPATDPRDMVADLLGDLQQGRSRRVLLTAATASGNKTQLALTMAKAVAARGYAVLVIDADSEHCGLSRLAIAEGLPARIEHDRMELHVLGIPSIGDGVVFVLPHDQVTGDLSRVDTPFIECRIAAVVIDGPAEGAALASVAAVADSCYRLDDQGYVRPLPLPLQQAAGVSADQWDPAQLDPRRFAEVRPG